MYLAYLRKILCPMPLRSALALEVMKLASTHIMLIWLRVVQGFGVVIFTMQFTKYVEYRSLSILDFLLLLLYHSTTLVLSTPKIYNKLQACYNKVQACVSWKLC